MRIILADHHVQPLWALGELVQEQAGFDLVGAARDAQGLLVLAEENSTDLILLDCDLPGFPIEELIARLHALNPRPVVIVMGSKFEDESNLIEAGADDYASKNDQPNWLLDKLNKYAQGFN